MSITNNCFAILVVIGATYSGIVAYTHDAFAYPAEEEIRPIKTIKLENKSNKHIHPEWIAFMPKGTRIAIRYSTWGDDPAIVAIYDMEKNRIDSTFSIAGGEAMYKGVNGAVMNKESTVAFSIANNIQFIPKTSSLNNHNHPKKDKPFGPTPFVTADSTQLWLDRSDSGYIFTCFAGFDFYSCYQWDSAKPMVGKRLLQERCKDFTTAFINPTKHKLIVAANTTGPKPKPVIDYWNLKPKPEKLTYAQPLLPDTIAISLDGIRFAAGYPDGTAAWGELDSRKAMKPIKQFCNFTIVCSDFHPTGKYLAYGSLDRGQPNLFLIDVESGKVLHKIAADASAVEALCFNKAGTRLATFGSSGVIKIWDANALIGSMQ